MIDHELKAIALYHFRHMRTSAKFLHISQIEKVGEFYIFYGLFEGKKKTFPKKLILTKEGNVVKLR